MNPNNKKKDFYQRYSIPSVIIGYLVIIILTLFIVFSSILAFVFTLAPIFRGITAILLFLIIPLFFLGIYVCINQKTKKFYNPKNERQNFILDVLKQTLIFSTILLFLFSLFLLNLYSPLQKQGVNLEPLTINVQPYLVNDGSWQDYNLSKLSQANRIYSKYNFTININLPKYLKVEINESYQKQILQQNCSILREIYSLTDNKETDVNLVIISYNGTSSDGMANLCGNSNTIIMSYNTTISADWVLAHEMGHILNAKISCWKFNLMKEYSGACLGGNWITHDFIRNLQPDFLNQEQVDVMVNTIKNKFG